MIGGLSNEKTDGPGYGDRRSLGNITGYKRPVVGDLDLSSAVPRVPRHSKLSRSRAVTVLPLSPSPTWEPTGDNWSASFPRAAAVAVESGDGERFEGGAVDRSVLRVTRGPRNESGTTRPFSG